MRGGRVLEGGALRVLVAEDNPVIALGLAERLRTLGHEPLGPASDGVEAIELARESDPDVYLFDIEMPRIDGLAAAAQLTAEGLRRPVVVITGVDDPSLVERSVANGVGAYLTKPVDTRALHAALELAAARYSELQTLETEVDRAQQALEDRKVVERAKGLLMTALALSEQDAFRRLQTTARERNLRLVDVAARIVEEQDLLAPKPPRPKRLGTQT